MKGYLTEYGNNVMSNNVFNDMHLKREVADQIAQQHVEDAFDNHDSLSNQGYYYERFDVDELITYVIFNPQGEKDSWWIITEYEISE